MESELRPASPTSTIKECDTAFYPNVSGLFKITCTIPVTSCEYEQSASILRRLNNDMRAWMAKSRLSSPALLHYDTTVDLDVVVDTYARLHPRKIQLENLL